MTDPLAHIQGNKPDDQNNSPASNTAGGAATSSSGWKPPKTSYLTMGIAVTLGICGALAILAAWKLPPFRSTVQTTQDAYVRGRTTVVSPQVSGYVVEVLAKDYQRVERGDLLVKIDDKTYRQKVDETKAEVDVALANLANNDQTIATRRAGVNSAIAAVSSARAQLVRATIDADRARKLVTEGSGAQSNLDSAVAQQQTSQATLDQAQASLISAGEEVKSAQVQGRVFAALVESARASLEQAQIDLSHTEIRAPESGQLSDIGVRLGQYVSNGSQLLFLVPETRWVVANFKETQIAQMAVGQRAWFTVDALDQKRFSGRVDQISPAAASEFSILRPDNATGNFTKIPQRITVRIEIDPTDQSEKLRPGMSVEAYVDTGRD